MEYKSFDKFLKVLVGALLLRYGNYYNDTPTDVPEDELDKEYDFIIVGGGTAGCVLANRLSEVSYWTILVIEAGGDETVESSVSLLWNTLENSILDWNFTTVPQKRACQETDGVCSLTLGKALGGSSTIDYLLHLRGNRKDFDRLKSEYNVNGWSYKELLPYFKKSENATDLKSKIGISKKYRGYNGPLHLEYASYSTKIQEDYFKAEKEFGTRYIKVDYNGKLMEDSIGYPQFTMKDQMRFSAARAYLYPVKDRENLVIIKNSFVVKLIIKNKKAIGVEYIRDGQTCRKTVRKEVLIAAGPINSAKLLMLSGIGPKSDLKKLGMSVIADLPVGQGLKAKPSVYMAYRLKKKVTLTTDVWMTSEAIDKYVKYRKGPLTTPGLEEVDFNGEPENPDPPTLTYGTYSFKFNINETNYDPIITIVGILTHPKSKGTLTLQSDDPSDPPLIDPNYLAEKEDYDILSSGVNDIIVYMKTPTMLKYSPSVDKDSYPECHSYSSKGFNRCLMNHYVDSEDRIVGTTPIGAIDSPDTVVDENLCLKDFENIRVVGSGIFPDSLTGYAVGATYAFAEKLSDMIKEYYYAIETTTTEAGTKQPSNPSQFQQAGEAFANLVQIMVGKKD